MGAYNIEFEMEGKATMSQIETRFKQQQANDRHENGARSYSGDFQTVHRVDYTYLDRVFNSYNEAHKFALEKAEKWVTVVAVRYVEVDFKPNAKVTKMLAQKKAVDQEIFALRHQKHHITGMKTCPQCKSKINFNYLKAHACPVCDEDMRPKATVSKLRRLESKSSVLGKRIEKEYAAIKEKALKKKNNPVNTLVAGWGAS